MSGELITRDGQYQLRDLLLGVGTGYPVESVDGLGHPALRTSDTERPLDDGAFPGVDLLLPRSLVIELGSFTAVGGTPSLATRIANLSAAMAPVRSGTVELAMRLRGWSAPRVLFGRPRRFELGDARGRWDSGQAIAILGFDALDPRYYAAADVDEAITIPAASTSAQRTFTVGGTYRTPPTLLIGGPARNPRVTGEEGAAARIDVDVQAGSTLEVDTAERTVKLDGVNAFEYVRADHEWWDLLAGSNTIVYSRASTALTGADSTLTVRHRPAWLSA